MQALRVSPAVVAPAARSVRVRAEAKWLPGSQAPAHLNGTLAGDQGFDPLGLGVDADRLKWRAGTGGGSLRRPGSRPRWCPHGASLVAMAMQKRRQTFRFGMKAPSRLAHASLGRRARRSRSISIYSPF